MNRLPDVIGRGQNGRPIYFQAQVTIIYYLGCPDLGWVEPDRSVGIQAMATGRPNRKAEFGSTLIWSILIFTVRRNECTSLQDSYWQICSVEKKEQGRSPLLSLRHPIRTRHILPGRSSVLRRTS